MKKYTLPGLVCLLLFSVSAEARERACCVEPPDWYMGMSGGITFIQDIDLEETTPTGLTHTVKLNTGFNVAGQVGYRVLSNARIELEGIMLRNKVDAYVGNPALANERRRNVETTTAVMANGYLDFLLGREVSPYVGAGIGRAFIDVPLTRTLSGETHKMEGWANAYQFLAGANFVVPDSPFYFSLGYRYFNTFDAKVDYNSIGPYNVEFNHTSHNIELGGKIFF